MSDGDAQPALLNAFLLTTKDALMVFEAARRGICPVITRRLQDNEKQQMIISGSVFAFDEQATGIKRWTDGALWSPSRIIGNYLIYRELDKKGDKEAGRSSVQSGPSTGTATSPAPPQSDPFDTGTDVTQASLENSDGRPTTSSVVTGSTGLHRELERALVGSLTTSYKFRRNGLIKKTISNANLHLISYYTIDDVLAGRLRTPSSLIELASLEISSALLEAKNFRMPPLTEQDAEGKLRYIGEESDPVSAPPILAPLLAPGAMPVSRPLSAVMEYRHAVPGPSEYQPYEAVEQHPFAYRPADDNLYEPAARPEEGDLRMSATFQHSPVSVAHLENVQPLWAHQAHQDQLPIDQLPVAGPSEWRARSTPSGAPSYPQHPQHYQPPQHHQNRPDLLQRSHSNASPGYGQQQDSNHSHASRPYTQLRRSSYKTPGTIYPYPPRSEPHPRHSNGRPATSPAPSPVPYTHTSYHQNDFRTSVTVKPESNSPGLHHAVRPDHPSHSSPQLYNARPSVELQPQYAPPSQAYSYSYSGAHYPPPGPYETAGPSWQSTLPPRTAPAAGMSYLPSQPHYYDSGIPNNTIARHPIHQPPEAYHPPYQEARSAPSYPDTFQQRASQAGPSRQRFEPKAEDVS